MSIALDLSSAFWLCLGLVVGSAVGFVGGVRLFAFYLKEHVRTGEPIGIGGVWHLVTRHRCPHVQDWNECPVCCH